MRSQRNYEKNERQPDANYLAAFAAAGGDVLFLLTGPGTNVPAGGEVADQQRIPVPKIEPISRREQALIANYRNSTEEGKRALEGVASATAHMDRGEKRQGGE